MFSGCLASLMYRRRPIQRPGHLVFHQAAPRSWDFLSALREPYGSDKRGKERKHAVTILSSFLFRSFHRGWPG